MKPLHIFRVSLVCALAVLPVCPTIEAEASSRLDLRVGYDSDPDGLSKKSQGDAWAAVTVGTTQVRETGGPLSLTLDLALGATAYARLTDLDRVSLVLTPAADYVFSPSVAARLALVAEGQFVNDDRQSAWGWGGSLRLRERLATGVDLSEYLSYRDLTARDAEYSGTQTAVGLFLRVFLGERWLLGLGGEYAHGDFLAGDGAGQGSGSMGTGTHRTQNYNQTAALPGDQPLVSQDETRLAGSLGVFYDWSNSLSTGLEYSFTHVNDDDGGDDQHGVILSTTYAF